MKEEKFPHTRKPLHWQRWEVVGGSFRAMEESTAIGMQRTKHRDPRTEDPHIEDPPQPERLVCSPTSGCGLGAEAPASEVRSQGEDWGWLHEHNLKGVSATQLTRRKSRKMSGTA